MVNRFIRTLRLFLLTILAMMASIGGSRAQQFAAGSDGNLRAGLNPNLWGDVLPVANSSNSANMVSLAPVPHGPHSPPSMLLPPNDTFPASYSPPSPPLATTATTHSSTTSPLAATKQPIAKTIPFLAVPKLLKQEVNPRNDRVWIANHAVSPTATFDGNGDIVTLYNIRFTDYTTDRDYTTHYFNARYNLNDIRTMDMLEIPFPGMPTMAHVACSFGFADGRHLGVSVEARYEVGESYDPVAGLFNQFELIYIIADERDMIRLSTDYKKCDVHLYRLKLTPMEVRGIFVDILNRANKLAVSPEFYKTVRNNCTTNIIDHINRVKPGAIPYEYRVLFPGLIDSFLFDIGLLENSKDTFKETKQAAKINSLAERYGNTEYFSAGIRQNIY